MGESSLIMVKVFFSYDEMLYDANNHLFRIHLHLVRKFNIFGPIV